jgi:alkyl hydroperoxide reductase subunit AhpC
VTPNELLRKVKAAQYVASRTRARSAPPSGQEGAATLTPSLDLVGKI